MSYLDKRSILAEAVSRLVELALDEAVRGTPESTAVDNLVSASGWNPALLTVATARARRLAEESADDRLEAASEHLRSAHQRVRDRVEPRGGK